jgi:alpha-mannosidase
VVGNTYWETNFRAHQPGGVHARYRVYPHTGGFDPARAYRNGMDAAHNQPLLQRMGEPPEQAVFPETGSLLRLPETLDPAAGIFTLHIKPERHGQGITVRLYNAGGQAQTARIGSGLLRLTAAHQCDLFENALQPLDVVDGGTSVDIPPGQITTLRLTVETARA